MKRPWLAGAVPGMKAELLARTWLVTLVVYDRLADLRWGNPRPVLQLLAAVDDLQRAV
jgi:hypothetical protein